MNGSFADIDPKNIINMDETPMYFDMGSGITYDTQGSKDVLSKNTGYDKLRFTVVLSITAEGGKLDPMIIFKNLKDVPKLKKGEKWPAGNLLLSISVGFNSDKYMQCSKMHRLCRCTCMQYRNA